MISLKNDRLPKALKSCPKSNKSDNLVTLIISNKTEIIFKRALLSIPRKVFDYVKFLIGIPKLDHFCS